MTTLKLLTLLLPAAALACGSRAVDLDGDGPRVSPSNEPGVLGVLEGERVTSLAVDDERLYWIGTWQGQSSRDPSVLRSCRKDDCAHTVVTYDPHHVTHTNSFALYGGKVYWSEGWAPFVPPLILACDVKGCESGVSSVTTQLTGDVLSMVSDGEEIFFFARDGFFDASTIGIYRVPLSGPDNPPARIFKTRGEALLALGGEYLYWLDSSTPLEDTLQRTLVNGDGRIELIAENLVIQGQNQHRLTLDESNVYWSQNSLRGAILSCPLTGCPDTTEPEIVAGPIRSPEAVWLDGNGLYWTHDTASQGYTVSSCQVADCAPTDVGAPGSGASGAVAFDQTYIYTAPITDTVSQSLGTGAVTTRLRRFSKAEQ